MVQKTETLRESESVEDRLALDPDKASSEIVNFVRDLFRSSGASGIVVGLSGGIDSSVTTTLCVKAVGNEKVTGVLLFEGRMVESVDAQDARELANRLQIRTLEFNIDSVIAGFTKNFPLKSKGRVAFGNLKARVRMMSLYYVANCENLLVAGTGDKSEDLIGYFTKYGDGGVDFLPIAHLYKSQVKELGRFLGFSDRIVSKPSSPNLWEGHRAADEIPLDYAVLDKALIGLVDLRLKSDEVAEKLGLDPEKIIDVQKRFHSSAHKRAYPPMLRGW